MKFMFRLVLVAALAAFIGVFAYALHTDETNTGPEEMVSPFRADAKANIGTGSPAADQLARQNLSARELAARLNDILAEAMSFNKNDYAINIEQNRKYFTSEGYAQYLKFIEGLKLQDTLRAQDLQSGVIIEQAPLELTNGVYEGRYKWVFEIPVMVSLIPRISETYRNDAIDPVNRRFLFRVQMARVRDADPEAVRIEIWDVLPPRPQPRPGTE